MTYKTIDDIEVNEEEEKNAGGRPQKFQSVEELQKAIDAYFEECDNSIDRPYTISGLAEALGTTRETLMDYQKKGEFSDTVKRAKLRCLVRTEEKCLTGTYNAGMGQFILKNNYGFKDTHTHEVGSGKRKDNEYDQMSEEELLLLIEGGKRDKESGKAEV